MEWPLVKGKKGGSFEERKEMGMAVTVKYWKGGERREWEAVTYLYRFERDVAVATNKATIIMSK